MFARLRSLRILAHAANGGPWGQGPRRPPEKPQGRPPGAETGADTDLDAALRQAQDKFRTIFGGGGGKKNDGMGRVLGYLAGILILLWLASGFYRVEPQENAVILTFGQWTNTQMEAGLGYVLPWPIQDIRKVDVAFDRRVEIGFRDQTHPRGAASDQPAESLMLTGDENIIDIDFVVLWRINDAGKYLFQIRDPETTVKKVAESAMREIIGRTAIQRAMTEARSEVEANTRDLMQRMLDEYNSGIVINSVQLLKVDPPTQVVDAFVDVQRARADRERARNEAETYRNDIIPRARGQAQKLVQDGEAYKESVTIRAQGEADRFTAILAASAKGKDVTQRRMYIETLQNVMENSRKLIVSDNGKGPSVLPFLPLEQLGATRPAATTTTSPE